MMISHYISNPEHSEERFSGQYDVTLKPLAEINAAAHAQGLHSEEDIARAITYELHGLRAYHLARTIVAYPSPYDGTSSNPYAGLSVSAPTPAEVFNMFAPHLEDADLIADDALFDTVALHHLTTLPGDPIRISREEPAWVQNMLLGSLLAEEVFAEIHLERYARMTRQGSKRVVIELGEGDDTDLYPYICAPDTELFTAADLTIPMLGNDGSARSGRVELCDETGFYERLTLEMRDGFTQQEVLVAVQQSLEFLRSTLLLNRVDFYLDMGAVSHPNWVSSTPEGNRMLLVTAGAAYDYLLAEYPQLPGLLSAVEFDPAAGDELARIEARLSEVMYSVYPNFEVFPDGGQDARPLVVLPAGAYYQVNTQRFGSALAAAFVEAQIRELGRRLDLFAEHPTGTVEVVLPIRDELGAPTSIFVSEV